MGTGEGSGVIQVPATRARTSASVAPEVPERISKKRPSDVRKISGTSAAEEEASARTTTEPEKKHPAANAIIQKERKEDDISTNHYTKNNKKSDATLSPSLVVAPD
jgi:hypothetical protein